MSVVDEMAGKVEDVPRSQIDSQDEIKSTVEQEIEECEDEKETDQDESSRNEKLKKLGEFCHSLGLQPKRLTDKMLNTIEMSKDIERNQRNVISKLNSAASLDPQEEENEEDIGNPDNEDGETSVVQVDENNEANNARAKKIAELNSSSKSLRRKRIPPPLSIQNSAEGTMCNNSANSSATTHSNNLSLYPQSAPANVPNFPRHAGLLNKDSCPGKPRVQYLGKVSNGMSRQQYNGFKLKTPFVPNFPRLSQQQAQQMQQPTNPSISAHYPYFPYMYPMYQMPPYGPQMMPRSAVPYSPQAQYYQDNDSHKRRHQQAQSANQKQNTAKRIKVNKDKTEDSLREKNNNKKDNDNDKKRANDLGDDQSANNTRSDTTDNSQIQIEDSTLPETVEQQACPIMGEIRILTNVFSFEFPVNGPAIDKKMFMSICNSVWDKSEDLAKNNRQ